MRIVVALGGNALLQRGETPDAATQIERVRVVAAAIAQLGGNHELVITHGNGPQIGLLALESSTDTGLSHPYPLDALGAETQGLVGYWLQQAIANADPTRRVVTLVCQTVVASIDPAFGNPTKFVGASYPEAEAHAVAAQHDWSVARDGNAWRHVVPSPKPIRIVETSIIHDLVALGVTVVCAGGGGCPVIETEDGLRGVDAVIDKDHVAAMLALSLHADKLLLLTDVDAVIDGYGTPGARPLGNIDNNTIAHMQFAEGSMAPKVAAACHFAAESKRVAAIGSLSEFLAVLDGTRGTQIH